MAYFHVPPHVIYHAQTQKISGAVYDLIAAMAPEWGVNVTWDRAPTNIPRQIQQLEKGHQDAAALFIYNPDHLPKFAYSRTAYFHARNAVVVKKDNPLKAITKIEDILPLKIGYAPKAYVSGFMRDSRIHWEYVYAPNLTELNLLKLLMGRIDAAYAPDHTALWYEINLAGAREQLRLVYTPEPQVSFHIGFSHTRPLIRQKFDAAFEKLNGAQKYAEFLNKYIGEPL